MPTWLSAAGTRLLTTTLARAAQLRRSDRGDVPGWVMVTLMSAMLVAAIIVIAETELSRILNEALGEVLP